MDRSIFVLLAAALAVVAFLGAGAEGKDSSEEKSHVDGCDKYCGVKGVFKSGSCGDCCREKEYRMGGKCGDFMKMHCKCVAGGGSGGGRGDEDGIMISESDRNDRHHDRDDEGFDGGRREPASGHSGRGKEDRWQDAVKWEAESGRRNDGGGRGGYGNGDHESERDRRGKYYVN